MIVLATENGHFGIGAGTVVEKSGNRVQVLTAAHVATFGTLQLRLADGSVAPARVVAVVGGRDLAVIEADLAPPEAAALNVAPVAAPRGRFSLQCTLCHKGDSGAGVFNNQGELVGVYVGYFEVGTGRISVAEAPAGAAMATLAASTLRGAAAAPIVVAAAGAPATPVPAR